MADAVVVEAEEVVGVVAEVTKMQMRRHLEDSDVLPGKEAAFVTNLPKLHQVYERSYIYPFLPLYYEDMYFPQA